MKVVQGWYFPDDDANISEHIRIHQGYQVAQRKEALSYCKEFNTALDIGAHVGTWSKPLADKFKTVYSFEPNPVNIECFKMNLKGYEDVCLFPFALGYERGFRQIRTKNKKSTGGTQIAMDGDPLSSYRVKIVPLDFMRLEEKIDFIKIDVEGFETFVIRGAKETITRNKPIICIEQKMGYEYYGLNKDSAFDELKELGMIPLHRIGDDYIWGWSK